MFGWSHSISRKRTLQLFRSILHEVYVFGWSNVLSKDFKSVHVAMNLTCLGGVMVCPTSLILQINLMCLGGRSLPREPKPLKFTLRANDFVCVGRSHVLPNSFNFFICVMKLACTGGPTELNSLKFDIYYIIFIWLGAVRGAQILYMCFWFKYIWCVRVVT